MGLIVEYNNGSFIHTPHAHTSGDRRTHQRSNGRGGPHAHQATEFWLSDFFTGIPNGIKGLWIFGEDVKKPD